MTNPFARVTEAHPSGVAGRVLGEIDESWSLRPLPQGGVVSALAARAMTTELADVDQSLRLLHTTFVAPVSYGPVEVEVEVLRRGRSMSHARAEVRNPGSSHGHLLTAVFGGPRRGFSFTDVDPPVGIIPLGEARSFRDPLPAGVEAFPPNPFWDTRLQGRGALGHAPWEDYVPDRAEHVTWYRLDDPPVDADGVLDPLALIVCADTMPGAVAEKLGPDLRMGWFGPSVDLTLHILDTCRTEWVLAHNRARYAGDGYASVDMALWDCGPDGTAAPRLVAYATQMCFFTFAT
jgi:acyl-CoA thioesterase